MYSLGSRLLFESTVERLVSSQARWTLDMDWSTFVDGLLVASVIVLLVLLWRLQRKLREIEEDRAVYNQTNNLLIDRLAEGAVALRNDIAFIQLEVQRRGQIRYVKPPPPIKPGPAQPHPATQLPPPRLGRPLLSEEIHWV